MKKAQLFFSNEMFIVSLVVVIIALPLYILREVYKPSQASDIAQHQSKNWFTPKEAHSPFKKKEVRSITTQNDDTTQTIEYATYPVELTEEQEQKYYGDHPEYEAWEAAYVGEVLHRYPPGWGYFGFTEMLTSDDSGANSGTVVSMHLARVTEDGNEIWNHGETLNAPIGYETPYRNIHYIKTDEFITLTDMKVAKYEDDNGKQIRQRFIVAQPDGWYLDILVNGMNYDTYEKHKETIDRIIRSTIYVPYEYR